MVQYCAVLCSIEMIEIVSDWLAMYHCYSMWRQLDLDQWACYTTWVVGRHPMNQSMLERQSLIGMLKSFVKFTPKPFGHKAHDTMRTTTTWTPRPLRGIRWVNEDFGPLFSHWYPHSHISSLNNIVTVCNRQLTNQVIRAILCTWLRDRPAPWQLNTSRHR